MAKNGILPLLFSIYIIYIFTFNIPSAVFASSPPGLGQVHWIGGPLGQNPGLQWGYSSSIPFGFAPGEGDHWAAVETVQNQYNFSQIRQEINYVKNIGKKIWLQLQVADSTNKEHNIPKWALDKGIEMYEVACADRSLSNYFVNLRWTDVAPFVNNAQYVDPSEMERYQNGATEMVRFPRKLPAIWDPKFQQYYLKAVTALKNEFAQEISEGIVSAFQLFSGGQYGEHIISSKCEAWNDDCQPDVLNPSCPAIISMAKIKNIAPSEIAKKSNCSANNLIPGQTVQICNSETCPTQYGSYCYVFDDYLIQAVKEMISKQAAIFPNTPLVWQTGPGLSGTGRTAKAIEDWMTATYGSRVYLKFNGWNPSNPYFYSSNFQRYTDATLHGYEAHGTWFFDRSYWHSGSNAASWCQQYPTSPKPAACNSNPPDVDLVAKTAIAKAIKTGIVDDKSSFLGMQSEFFTSSISDRGAGKMGNQFYFNPQDFTPNCSNSEINVAQFGVGFCPGFLNDVFSRAENPQNPPSLPDQPAQDSPVICPVCPADRIAKNKGNANCDAVIDGADYRIWKDVFIKIKSGQQVSEIEKGSVDFNCRDGQNGYIVDLTDFEILRRNNY